jgi:hypothetical protein
MLPVPSLLLTPMTPVICLLTPSFTSSSGNWNSNGLVAPRAAMT